MHAATVNVKLDVLTIVGNALGQQAQGRHPACLRAAQSALMMPQAQTRYFCLVCAALHPLILANMHQQQYWNA